MLILLAIIATLISCFLGVIIHSNRRLEKQFKAQTALIKQALHASLGQTGNINKKLDAMKVAAHNRSVFQKKSSEHHRVLLASLNRQMKSLENMVTPQSSSIGNISEIDYSSKKSSDISGTETTAENRSVDSKGSKDGPVIKGKPSDSILKLETLFRNRMGIGTQHQFPQNHPSVVSASDQQAELEKNLRRVSNG